MPKTITYSAVCAVLGISQSDIEFLLSSGYLNKFNGEITVESVDEYIRRLNESIEEQQ